MIFDKLLSRRDCSQKLNGLLPQTYVTIPILFFNPYPQKGSSEEPIMDFITRHNIKFIKDSSTLCDLFNNSNYVNAICLSHYLMDGAKLNKEEIPAFVKNQNKDDFKESFHINKDFKLKLYYLDERTYENLVKDIEIVNTNGKFFILANNQYIRFKRKVNNFEALEIITVKKNHERDGENETIIGGFDTIERLIRLFAKNGKVLFLGMRENYDYPHSFLRETRDVKKLVLRTDLEAIVRFSVIAHSLNIYKSSSLWSEHLLSKQPDMVFVIDENMNILYTNEEFNSKHKSNNLGKKCYDVFKGSNCDSCDICRLIKEEIYKNQNRQRLANFISDKAGNQVHINEHVTVAKLKNYTKRIGIVTCRDTTVRETMNELLVTLQSKSTLLDIKKSICQAFKRIGFENFRMYLNFGAPFVFNENREGEVETDTPDLILVYSTEQKHHNNIGAYIPGRLLTELALLRGDLATEVDPITYLYKTIEKRALEISTKQNIVIGTELYRFLFNTLRLPEKWLDIPLWNGTHLIGIISVDYGNDNKSWPQIDSFFKYEVFASTNLISIAINNFFFRRLSSYFNNLTQEINKIQKKEGIEEEICRKVFDCFTELQVTHYPSSLNRKENSAVLFYLYRNSEKESSYELHSNFTEYSFKKSGSLKIDSYVYKSTVYDARSCLLYDNNKNLVIESNDIEKYKDLDDLAERFGHINSVGDVKLSFKGKVLGVIRIIKTGKGDIPIPYFFIKLINMVSDQIATLLNNFYFRLSFKRIVSSTTSLTIPVKASVKEYVVNSFANLQKVYPNTALTLYLKYDDRLSMVAYHNTGDDKQEISLNYELPPKELSNQDKITWLRTHKKGLTPSFLYSVERMVIFNNRKELDILLSSFYKHGEVSRFDEVFPHLKYCESECIRQIEHNGEVIGLLKFQDKAVNRYQADEDFDLLTDVLATQFGHTIVLINEIKKLDEYSSVIIHETRTPIGAISNITEGLIGLAESTTNYDILEYSFSFEDRKPITINNDVYLYNYLRRLHSECELMVSIIEAPTLDTINWQNVNIVLGYIETQIGYAINTQRHKEHSEKKKSNPEVIKKLQHQQIYYEKNIFKLALYNIFGNAFKYRSPKETPVFVDGYHQNKDGKEFYIIEVQNFGPAIKVEEKELVFCKNERGTNAGDTTGFGLGLYYARKVLEFHAAKISLNPLPKEGKTQVIVEIDIAENSRRLKHLKT